MSETDLIQTPAKRPWDKPAGFWLDGRNYLPCKLEKCAGDDCPLDAYPFNCTWVYP